MKQGTRTLVARVMPNASQTKVQEIEPDKLYVRVTAPPREGKANEAVIAAVADYYGLKKRQITIIRGLRSREKIIIISFP